MATHTARAFVDVEHPWLVTLVSLTHGFNEFFSFAGLGVVLYSVSPAASASTEGSSGSLFAVTNTASAIGGALGPFLLGTVADAASLNAVSVRARSVGPNVGLHPPTQIL